jgi:hypothetical protein
MLREIRQKLDKEARQEFDADAKRIRQFVAEYRDAVKGVSDFIDRAAERVLEMQGRVEEVRGLAAESLQEYGNIGAFLRW